MENWDWTVRDKPYEIRERLLNFACLCIRVVQYLHTRGPIATALSYQILASSNSAGANYEEADDGSSPADRLSKRRIALREVKETLFRLRVLRKAGFLTAEHDPVLAENDELKRILATIVRKTRESARKRRKGADR
jgi:four helix bundle protein